MIRPWHKFDIPGKDWLAICFGDDDDCGGGVCVCVCLCDGGGGIADVHVSCGSLGETENWDYNVKERCPLEKKKNIPDD